MSLRYQETGHRCDNTKLTKVGSEQLLVMPTESLTENGRRGLEWIKCSKAQLVFRYEIYHSFVLLLSFSLAIHFAVESRHHYAQQLYILVCVPTMSANSVYCIVSCASCKQLVSPNRSNQNEGILRQSCPLPVTVSRPCVILLLHPCQVYSKSVYREKQCLHQKKTEETLVESNNLQSVSAVKFYGFLFHSVR